MHQIDSVWLKKQYCDLRRTSRDIAKEIGCDKSIICRRLKKFNIPIRNSSESKIKEIRSYMSVNWLNQQYINQKRNSTSIAKEFNVCSATIRKWLKKLKIPIRSLSESRQGLLHWNFKGVPYFNPAGYRYIYAPNHPRAKARPYMLEHILVMEKYLGRLLKKGEEIHHKDGNPSNNSLDNLQLFSSSSDHITYEMQLRDFAKKILFNSTLIPSNRDELLKMFNKFVNEQG